MVDNLQIKIYDKLFVGFERDGDNMPTGRMCNYAETKGNQKLRDDIEYWSNRSLGGKSPLNSIMIDNKPLTGFRISRSQINAGWYQTPTHIRVEDPRGFEVNITIQNMIMLTNMNALDNGEIMQECVWGRDDKINVLLPTNSLPYQEAIKNTDRLSTHVHVSKLKLGDHVTLKNGKSGRYMGKLTEVVEHEHYRQYGHSANSSAGYYRRDFKESIIESTIKVEDAVHYIEQTYEDNKGVEQRRYLGYASPNVSRIEKSEPLTPQEVSDRLVEARLKQYQISGKSYGIVFLMLGKAVIRNWKFNPATNEEIDEFLAKTRSKSNSLLNRFYGRVDGTSDVLLAFTPGLNSSLPTQIEHRVVSQIGTEFNWLVKTVEHDTIDVDKIKFERLEFEIYVEAYDYKVTVTV